MLVPLLGIAGFFYVALSLPIAPTSYVYRSDGVNHGHTKTVSFGSDKEYNKVIVKRYELPAIETSYFTYITHPVSYNYDQPYDERELVVKRSPFVDEYWPETVYCDEEYLPDDTNIDQAYDDGRNSRYKGIDDEAYWELSKDDEDVEQYILKLFQEPDISRRGFVPKDVWYGEEYFNDAFGKDALF